MNENICSEVYTYNRGRTVVGLFSSCRSIRGSEGRLPSRGPTRFRTNAFSFGEVEAAHVTFDSEKQENVQSFTPARTKYTRLSSVL